MILAQDRRHRRRDAQGSAARQQQAARGAARSIPHGKPEGNYLVAVDTVDAGVGETVLIVSGSSARMAAGHEGLPGRRRHRRHRRSRSTSEDSRRAPCSSPASSATSSRRVKDASLDGPQAARAAAARRRPASRSAARSSPSTRSAPASASTCSSCAARKPAFPFYPAEVPADAGIVGIVDHWDASSASGTERAHADRPRRRHRRRDAEAPQVRGREAAAGAAARPRWRRRAARRCWRSTRSAPASARRCCVVIEGRAAGEALGRKAAPVDAAIIGIVDAVTLDDRADDRTGLAHERRRAARARARRASARHLGAAGARRRRRWPQLVAAPCRRRLHHRASPRVMQLRHGSAVSVAPRSTGIRLASSRCDLHSLRLLPGSRTDI